MLFACCVGVIDDECGAQQCRLLPRASIVVVARCRRRAPPTLTLRCLDAALCPLRLDATTSLDADAQLYGALTLASTPVSHRCVALTPLHRDVARVDDDVVDDDEADGESVALVTSDDSSARVALVGASATAACALAELTAVDFEVSVSNFVSVCRLTLPQHALSHCVALGKRRLVVGGGRRLLVLDVPSLALVAALDLDARLVAVCSVVNDNSDDNGDALVVVDERGGVSLLHIDSDGLQLVAATTLRHESARRATTIAARAATSMAALRIAVGIDDGSVELFERRCDNEALVGVGERRPLRRALRLLRWRSAARLVVVDVLGNVAALETD